MDFFCPVRIIQTDSFLDYLIDNGLYCSKTIIVTTHNAAKRHDLNKRRHNDKPILVDSIFPNPTVQLINKILREQKDREFNCVISLGGGSVIDAGKVIALCHGRTLDCRDIIPQSNVSRKIKHIAVPTTLGTGSETSRGAILSDYEACWKGGVRGDHVFPDIAILDSKIASKVPLRLALQTGFDALTHAIETYCSKASSPFSRMLSETAITGITQALTGLAESSNELQNSKSEQSLRLKLQHYACVAGICLANSSTCLPHRLQYAIGSLTDSAHADGLAAIYPAWFRHLTQRKPELANHIEKLMNVGGADKSDPMQSLIYKIGMNQNLRQLGFARNDIDNLVQMTDGNLALDPSYRDKQDVERIFKESF